MPARSSRPPCCSPSFSFSLATALVHPIHCAAIRATVRSYSRLLSLHGSLDKRGVQQLGWLLPPNRLAGRGCLSNYRVPLRRPALATRTTLGELIAFLQPAVSANVAFQ